MCTIDDVEDKFAAKRAPMFANITVEDVISLNINGFGQISQKPQIYLMKFGEICVRKPQILGQFGTETRDF